MSRSESLIEWVSKIKSAPTQTKPEGSGAEKPHYCALNLDDIHFTKLGAKTTMRISLDDNAGTRLAWVEITTSPRPTRTASGTPPFLVNANVNLNPKKIYLIWASDWNAPNARGLMGTTLVDALCGPGIGAMLEIAGGKPVDYEVSNFDEGQLNKRVTEFLQARGYFTSLVRKK